jgi:enoyl-CoA hydratase/carnithine racemase
LAPKKFASSGLFRFCIQFHSATQDVNHVVSYDKCHLSSTSHDEASFMQHVDVKVHDCVATILMDRPLKRNSLSPLLVEDLIQAFSDVHQEKRVRGVVLTGAGEHFCSGADLDTFREISELPAAEAMQQWFEHWNRLTELFETLLRFPKPIIAAVDGAAIGTGLGLVMACDLVVVSTKSMFLAETVRRGLVDGAAAALVNFRLGGAVTARMFVAGETLTANEIHRLGGCSEPVTPELLWVAASNLARKCAEGSPEAIQATKRAINEGIGEQLLTQLSAGAAGSATLCTTESASEGVRAFLEKRPPKWP